MQQKLALCGLVVLFVAVVVVLDTGCESGWPWSVCVENGYTIYPPAGGEFLLTEVASLALALIGVALSLLAYAHGDRTRMRIAVVFLMLFIAAFIGENNLMRDDLRPQFLIVLLTWLGVELLLRRLYSAIALLVLGCLVAFVGSLGDHTTHIQFQNIFDEDISSSPLASLEQLFGQAEETLELCGWTFFVLAAIRGLDLKWRPRPGVAVYAVITLAIIAVTVGNTFLHVRDHEQFEAARKAGFFCSIAGVGLVWLGAHLDLKHIGANLRAHKATLVLAAFFLFVFAPTVYTHEHSKTVSSWTWLVPLLALHYYLTTGRTSAASRAAATTAENTESNGPAAGAPRG